MSETFAVDPADDLRARSLTPHVALERVCMVVNPLSGGVGPGAAADARAILADYPLEAEVIELEAGGFDAAIAAALADRPDLLLILAGDGTAGTIAASVGPDGPLIATVLLDLLRRELPQAEVASFQFRALRPTFDGAEMRVNGAREGRKARSTFERDVTRGCSARRGAGARRALAVLETQKRIVSLGRNVPWRIVCPAGGDRGRCDVVAYRRWHVRRYLSGRRCGYKYN
jgi:hypothetical protein